VFGIGSLVRRQLLDGSRGSFRRGFSVGASPTEAHEAEGLLFDVLWDLPTLATAGGALTGEGDGLVR
jgi:hypothetical protein